MRTDSRTGARCVWLLIMIAGLSQAMFGQPVATQCENRVLANSQLSVRLRPNLTLAVEDLSAKVTWGSDPWENSAGRVHLRGKHGESVTVSLGSAATRKVYRVIDKSPGGHSFAGSVNTEVVPLSLK